MSLRARFLSLSALILLVSGALAGQTPTPTPTPTTSASATSWTTENGRFVTGVNISVQPDGSVWFLVPSNDRIVQLQPDGITFKQWQIRDDKNIGANPVDFVVDGKTVWFIENGESLINAGFSALGRLDTESGQLREWVIPGSRPAGFYLAPDGKAWIPQTNGRLQSIDLASLAVVDYRSTKTFAYTDVAVARDGALWMADFGNNRIVRYVPGADKETSWTVFDPLLGRLNPTQVQFDDAGSLWICEFSGNRMDRFDPATNTIAVYGGFLDPLHFDIFGGRIYVAEAPSANGRVVVLDPTIASTSSVLLTPETLDVGATPNRRSATIRDSTAIVTTFTSTKATAADADVKVTSPGFPGLLRTEFPFTNAYGISASAAGVWVGSEGRLVRLFLQTIGTAADRTVPVAAQFGVSPGARIAIETTIVNRGSAAVSGEALYLFSPGSFAPRTTFTVGPGETLVLPDTFKDASTNISVAFGPVRIRVTSGNADDLLATVRSARLLDDGASFGFSIPALSSVESLGQGASATVFLGARADSEVSIFGLYSPGGGDATATLVAPDGTVRGSRRFVLAPNAAEEFNPAASAFGVDPEPGDTIRVTVASGSVQPYANVFDLGSGDTAVSLPVVATPSSVLPHVTSRAAAGSVFLSDLFLANPDATRPANVTISLFPAGSPVPPTRLANVVVPAGGSLAIPDALTTLFPGSGEGALALTSDAPVAASARIASRRPEGDYAGFERAQQAGAGGAIFQGQPAQSVGAPQTDTRQTDLILFNGGQLPQAASVTVTVYDGQGNATGQTTLVLQPGQVLRVPAVVSTVGGGGIAGRIQVSVDNNAFVYAVTEQIDLETGDVEIAPLK